MPPEERRQTTQSDSEVILLRLHGLDQKVTAELRGVRDTLESVASRTESIDDRLAEQGNRVIATALEIREVRQEVAVLKNRLDGVEHAIQGINKRMAATVAAITAAVTTAVTQALSNWDWVVRTLKTATGSPQ